MRPSLALAVLLAIVAPARASDDATPATGVLPVAVAKKPSAKDARALSAARTQLVAALAAERPELVDLATDGAVVVHKKGGRTARLAPHRGLATHVVLLEAKGKGKAQALTAVVMVVDDGTVLAEVTTMPFGRDKGTWLVRTRETVLGALPRGDTPPVVVAPPPTAPEPAVTAPEPTTTSAPPEAPPAVAREDEGGLPLWPFIAGASTLGAVGLAVGVGGAVLGTLAWLDSSAYVAGAGVDDALGGSALAKGAVADVLYLSAAVLVLAAGGVLAAGLVIAE